MNRPRFAAARDESWNEFRNSCMITSAVRHVQMRLDALSALAIPRTGIYLEALRPAICQ